MLQSGYSAEHIMPIMLDPINGLNNESNRLRRPADPKFTRPCRAVAGRSACRRHPDSHRTSQGWCRELRADFWTEQGPTARSKGTETKNIFGLKPDLRKLKVNYGGYSGRNDEIDMMTRSMLQIMLEFAAVVQVPESDVAQGKATPGLVDASGAALNGPPLRVLVTDAAPQDALVAAQYDERWFWIADTDIQSKYTFGIIMLLFSIADTGVRGSAPVVTIPANQ